ncbi:MAG: FAD-dependent oxidoreductase [Thermoleophilia bacterium]
MPPTAIIIGAGPAGCAVAVALADRGHHTCLIGEPDVRHTWAGESLPPGAGNLITSLFGDQALEDAIHSPAYGVKAAWGSDDLITTDFIAHPDGDGWHLNRAAFDSRLARIAADRGVEVISAHARAATRDADRWGVTIDGRTLHAEWVVDATGRGGGPLRGVVGGQRTYDRQVALVALAEHGTSTAAMTTIEAVPDGWWYSTPLPDGRIVVALVTDSDLVPAGDSRRQWWRAQLRDTHHIAPLVDVAVDIAPALHAAGTGHRDRLWGEGWALAGDAAISWDPLSSQGLVTAILMGSRLGAAIGRCTTGDSDALPEWERDYFMLRDEHLGLRSYYWSTEERWVGHAFWDRRRGVSPS